VEGWTGAMSGSSFEVNAPYQYLPTGSTTPANASVYIGSSTMTATDANDAQKLLDAMATEYTTETAQQTEESLAIGQSVGPSLPVPLHDKSRTTWPCRHGGLICFAMDVVKLLRVRRAYRSGAPFGDVAMLKLDALHDEPPEIAARLERVRGYAPQQDVAVLRRLPERSLGREYARFLDANGIEPLVTSDAMRARFRDRPYALRYTMTHDLHHVLTGFDAGLAGEIGVLAFNVGQGSAPVRRALFYFACVLYSIVAPAQARRIWRNARVGLAMGRAAELVIAEPVESYFEEPLDDVRTRFRIPDPRTAGVVASRTSLVARLLYPSRRVRVISEAPR
jgi:ubiquinone biosynthesis protein COQ4